MPIRGENQLADQTMGENFEETSVSEFDSQEVWTGNRIQSAIGRRAMGPAYTFILPDLYQFPDGFRQFLERDMIEMPTLRRLEQSGHLNWWCVNQGQRLYPLVTTGDGNCLLHAASLGTWGVHDRQLHLRETLYNVLKNGARRHAFWRRWRWSESKMNLQSELVLSEEEWAKEWNDVLQMAAPTPRTSQVSETPANCPDGPSKSHSTEQIYESLETIHVFALAHILKRPIVIVSDTVLRNANGEELSPIPFGGIYLPLECPPEQCHRSPLVLCYDSSHFSALVAMRNASNSCLPAIPVMDKNRNILPVHFAIDPSPDFTWWKDSEDHRIAAELDSQMTEDYRLELISKYMDIVKMDLRRGSIKKTSPFVPSENPMIPMKLMTLASGGGDIGDKSNPSRIMKELKNHFKKLGSLGKKDKLSPRRFSAAELRQSNCILTALLHNFAHQYTDSMVDNYISGAKRRFDEMRTLSTNFTPKNRMSRSFSSSSVLLTCLNTHCDKTASPSTNFLCPVCFEDQKREMASIGTSNNHVNSNSQFNNQYPGLYASYKNVNGTNKKSNTMPVISATTILDAERNNISIASTDIYFDSEPEEFDYEEDLLERKKNWNTNNDRTIKKESPPPIPPRRGSEKYSINRTNIHITPGTAHCHNGNSPNISAANMTYQYAATRS